MKIVYCISGMFKLGGIERVIANKVNYLVNHGYEACIITTDQAGRPDFFPIDERVERVDLGLNYEAYNELPTWKRYWETWRKRSLHKARLEEELKRLHADVVVSVWRQEASFLPDLRDGSCKVLELHTSKFAPVLMYPAEQKLKRLLGRIRVFLQERTAARYDRFVILTQEEKPQWSGLPNLRVIPNPLSFSSKKRADLSAHRVMMAGRMEYVKNFPELLQIWSRVVPDFPDWKLHLCGDGWMINSFKLQAEKLGIASSVKFEGAVTDMETAYTSSSICLLTSHFEGFSMVLAEAQSVGLPAVSYMCPSGPRDIITDGKDGFLVPHYDQETFAERLRTLMRDEELRHRMGQAAEKASHRYDLDVIKPQWLSLFNELVK
jgi:glycosyltransferase